MNSYEIRGGGRLGCFLLLLVIAGLLFIGTKVGPVYLAKINLEDDLTSITSKAGVYGWTERMISKEIMSTAQSLGFKINNEDIRISRINRYQQAPRIQVTIKVSKKVEFPGYTHVFVFDLQSSGLIGAL